MTAFSAGLAEELEAEARAEIAAFGRAVVERIQRMLVAEGHCKPGSPLLDEAFAEPDPDGLGVTVGLGTEIAVFLEFGTAPHPIDAKPGGVLTNGREFFGTHVDHPGTEPYYVVRRAVLAEADARGLL